MKNRLKELRQQRQWSQADLARELRISRQAVNGFESGKFDPSLDMAFKISGLFGASIQDIFIHEVKDPMQTLVERFTTFLGFEFGFERFTESAIDAIKFAQSEASKARSSKLEPEHLLAGLLADPAAPSARLLGASGMRLHETREHSFESKEKPKISSQSRFVMEMALQIVRLRGKKSIGTEHLLWGLVRLSETGHSTLSDLFQRYEIDLSTLNQKLAEAV
ncbi:helix-turn-helix domain-containing protein [Altericista sp. CCNU0014]|uniref:helix-turn-helix transcriptional regulator n=1 Tax=Altericista sp. CCNU0014 TaxID=3082949 RepID=UPI00384A4814